LSTTAPELIVFRLLQGLGGAMLLANSVAIITEAFPPNARGRAMGINAVVWAIGSIAGPLLGGFILAIASWRWVFLVNLPIGIVATGAALLLLRESSSRNQGERFDAVGAGRFSLSLVSLLFALNRGIGLGFTSPIILGLFGATVAFAVAFYYWSRAAFVDGMHAALHLSIALCTIAAIGWWFAAAPADDPARRLATPAVSLSAE